MLNLHTCFAPTCFPEKREDLGLNDDEQIELTVAFYSVAVETLFIRLVLNYELPGTLKLVDNPWTGWDRGLARFVQKQVDQL